MTVSELHAKMEKLRLAYVEALAQHALGAAIAAREDAARLLAQEWEQVNAALAHVGRMDYETQFRTIRPNAPNEGRTP